MKRRYLVVAGAALVIATPVGAALDVPLSRSDSESRDYRGSTPHSSIELPDFALRDHRGSLVESDTLRGLVVVVTFLETKCEEPCPFIAGTLGTAFRRMSSAERQGVVALAVSTHPRDDTPVSARRFLRRERAERFIRYLVGSEADCARSGARSRSCRRWTAATPTSTPRRCGSTMAKAAGCQRCTPEST